MRNVRSTYLRRNTKGSSCRKEGLCFPKKKEATFLTETAADAAALKEAIDATGYTCLGIESAPYEKKGLFG